MKDWKSILFDNGDYTCGALDRFGTKLVPVSRLSEAFEFYSVNALAKGTKREDSNVTTYRNFLVEMDSVPLEEQIAIQHKIDLPHSLKVFSGKKSYHFVISLETALESESEYRAWATALLKAVPFADKANKNPSRLTRMPGHLREDTGQEQTLLEGRSRIANHELKTWIESRDIKIEMQVASRPTPQAKGLGGPSRPLNPFTCEFLQQGAPPGKRHARAIRAAFDMARAGWAYEEVIAKIGRVWPSATEHELTNVVAYAFQRR